MERGFIDKLQLFFAGFSCHKPKTSIDIGNLTSSTKEESLNKKINDEYGSMTHPSTVMERKSTNHDEYQKLQSPQTVESEISHEKLEITNESTGDILDLNFHNVNESL